MVCPPGHGGDVDDFGLENLLDLGDEGVYVPGSSKGALAATRQVQQACSVPLGAVVGHGPVVWDGARVAVGYVVVYAVVFATAVTATGVAAAVAATAGVAVAWFCERGPDDCTGRGSAVHNAQEADGG